MASQPPTTLNRDPACTACPLYQNVTTVCVPARAISRTPGHTTVVLIVGEAPGFNEDEQGLPFVGPAGSLLQKVYIQTSGLSQLADVYATNSVRCRPPSNAKPNKSNLNACLPFLYDDLKTLRSYYSEVVILNVGATATQQTLGMTLREAIRHQGHCEMRPPPKPKPKKGKS